MSVTLRRVLFNNLLPLAQDRHAPPRANGPAQEYHTRHVDPMEAFGFGDKPKMDTTPRRYKLPPAPAKGILKACLVADVGVETVIDGELDLEEEEVAERVPPPARRKLLAEMTDDEIRALDAKFEPTRKVDLSQLKFDSQDSLYFVLSAATAGATAKSLEQVREDMCNKLEGGRFANHEYPTRPSVKYQAITLVSTLGPQKPTRTVLVYSDKGRRHMQRACAFYFEELAQPRDHVVVVELAKRVLERCRRPLELGRRSSTGNGTERRGSVGGTLQQTERRGLADASPVRHTMLQIHALQSRATELLAECVLQLVLDAPAAITVEVADLEPAEVVKCALEVYEPVLIVVGDKLVNFNLRVVLTGLGSRGKGCSKLAPYVVKHSSDVGVCVVGKQFGSRPATSDLPGAYDAAWFAASLALVLDKSREVLQAYLKHVSRKATEPTSDSSDLEGEPEPYAGDDLVKFVLESGAKLVQKVRSLLDDVPSEKSGTSLLIKTHLVVLQTLDGASPTVQILLPSGGPARVPRGTGMPQRRSSNALAYSALLAQARRKLSTGEEKESGGLWKKFGFGKKK